MVVPKRMIKLLGRLTPIPIVLCTAPTPAEPEPSFQEAVRLYVLDCGQLNRGTPTRYNLSTEEAGVTNFSDPCYLIVHPEGRLLWEAGIIPDDQIEAGLNVQPPEGGVGSNQAFRTLRSQLEEIGYSAEDITHVAFSHSHWDHIANANDYAGAIWMVQREERRDMFGEEARVGGPGRASFATYSELEASRSVLLNGDHDVFEDGSVVLLRTPGHTPGHQSLYVQLDNYGPIVLSGDLWHYAAERELDRMPDAELTAGTPESRDRVEELLTATGGQLWIQHDIVGYGELRKAPAYYD